jgi:predicted RNA-binding protein with PUA-like domain
MPPKKGKKLVARAPSPEPEVPSTVTTPRGKIFDTTAAATRPKRTIASTMPPPDPPSLKKAKTTRAADASSNSEVTPKKRGRPPKASTATPKSATPKRATPKSASTATPKSFRTGERHSARLASTPASEKALPPLRTSRVTKSAIAPKRGRGRPPKKTKQTALKDNHDIDLESDANDEASDGIDYDDPTHDANITEATTIIQADRSYWLMKAEPESRIEKNANGDDVDVKFSIDDLRSRTEPEPWEGIRNAQAQNNMKAMKVGDLAFFYESNCKKPGIVGIMEIVNEASPDVHAFDKSSAYYDPKSDPKKPKWMLVHVEFRRKFSEKFTLKDLQKFSQSGGALAEMEVLKQSRLSVTKVTKPQWDFIMSQIDEDDEEDDVMNDFNGSMIEEDDDAGDVGADLGNDFAAAFEAPANLRTATDGIPDVVDQMSAYAADAPVPSARSVSRGRRSRPASKPAGQLAAMHNAAVLPRHANDTPPN